MSTTINMLEAKDIQEILKIGKNGAYQLMASDSFPSIKIGRKWLVSEEAFKEWLKDNEYCEVLL